MPVGRQLYGNRSDRAGPFSRDAGPKFIIAMKKSAFGLVMGPAAGCVQSFARVRDDVLWAVAAAGIVGLVLGLRFRIAAVLAASVLVLIGGVVAVPLTGLSAWTVLGIDLCALCALQGGYLAGLLLWCAGTRVGRLMPRIATRADVGDDVTTEQHARHP